MSAVVYLGIDVGGTGIKAAIVDAEGRILHRAEAPTGAAEGAGAVLGAHPAAGPFADGAGRDTGYGLRGRVAGPHRPPPGAGDLRQREPARLDRPALGAELHQAFGVPVVVDNDVNAAAMGEAWIGAARGTSDFLMLTLGTGVGGALTVHGRLWRGARLGAGEVGHMALYPGGEPCPCGGRGCAERYVSSKALTRRANEALTVADPVPRASAT